MTEEDSTCDYDYNLVIESVTKVIYYLGSGTVSRGERGGGILRMAVSVPRLKFLEKPYAIDTG